MNEWFNLPTDSRTVIKNVAYASSLCTLIGARVSRLTIDYASPFTLLVLLPLRYYSRFSVRVEFIPFEYI